MWFLPFVSAIVTACLPLLFCLFIVPSLIQIIPRSYVLLLGWFYFLLFFGSMNDVSFLQFGIVFVPFIIAALAVC